MDVSTTAELNLQPPPQLSMNKGEGLPERWKIWELQAQDFRTLARLSSAEESRMAMFRHAIEAQAVRCIKIFLFEADEDPEGWGNVLKKLECYCLGFTKDTF
ncbi:hypothetical protein P879_10838 [Paragonimus westermani]|uniref:Uncharacterized protein n=1 Tax=Paragonimus westermani TaxID=34504 RepID=A0A8T0DB35_9TREM|nr:hypothetical protein P879_10838 [Paragonimus westermani]